MELCCVRHINSIGRKRSKDLHTDFFRIRVMICTVSAHREPYTELQYHRKRFSFTNTILLYTTHLQAVSIHTLMYDHSFFTCSHYRQSPCTRRRCTILHFNWMWKHHQLEICWSCTMQTTFYSRTLILYCGTAFNIGVTAEANI